MSSRTPPLSLPAAFNAMPIAAYPPGLPMHRHPLPLPLPHQFGHHVALYDVKTPPTSLSPTAEDYYARDRRALAIPCDRIGEVDGVSRSYDDVSAPTARRVDKSGLLVVAEIHPMTYSHSREKVAPRTTVSRADRPGLLETVPEAADQSEEHVNDISLERGSAAATGTLDSAAETTPRGETSDVACCSLERAPFLDDQTGSDEVAARSRSGPEEDVKEKKRGTAKTADASPQKKSQFNVSSSFPSITKATERLSHYLSLSPGSTLGRCLGKSRSRDASPSTSRSADADADADANADANTICQRDQKSAASVTKCTSAGPVFARCHVGYQSQSLASTSDYPAAVVASYLASPATKATSSPVMRGQRLQVGCSRDKFDSAPIDAIVLTAGGGPVIGASYEPSKEGAGWNENNGLPEEMRVEAEGCEHPTIGGHEEKKKKKSSFKGSNKLLDNDSIETLRVSLIRSEQL